MDQGRKGSGHSKPTYKELIEENKYLKAEMESNEKEFGDMYNSIHAENVQLQAKVLILQMENAEFIGIQSKIKSILTCDECDEKFENKEDFKEHILVKHQVELFKCDNCEKRCSTEESFKTHLRTVHNNKIFKCDHCKEFCHTKIELKVHIKTKHSEINEKTKLLKYQNELASTIQAQKSQLYENLINLKKKEDKIRSKCSCRNKYCSINHAKYSWSAAKSDKLHCQLKALTLEKGNITDEHIKTHINYRKNKIFECNVCDGEFCDVIALKKHQELIHSSMSYVCQECENVFQDEKDVRQHKKKVHVRNFGCQPCGMNYSSEGELIRHMEESHATNNQLEKTFFNPSLGISIGGEVGEV